MWVSASHAFVVTARSDATSDPDVISEAYNAHAVTLRLEAGGKIKLRLLSCETHGAADVSAVGPVTDADEAA